MPDQKPDKKPDQGPEEKAGQKPEQGTEEKKESKTVPPPIQVLSGFEETKMLSYHEKGVDWSARLHFDKNGIFKGYRITSQEDQHHFLPSFPKKNGKNSAISEEASQIMLNVIAGLPQLSDGQREQLNAVASSLGYGEPTPQKMLFHTLSESPFPEPDSEILYHQQDLMTEQLQNKEEDFLKPVEDIIFFPNQEEERGPTVERTKEGCAIVIKDNYGKRVLKLHTYPLLEENTGPAVAIMGYTLTIKDTKSVGKSDFRGMRNFSWGLIQSLGKEKIPSELKDRCHEALSERGYGTRKIVAVQSMPSIKVLTNS